MVTGATPQVEWHTTQTEARSDNHLFHWLPFWQGSSVRRDIMDRRGLVSLGAYYAYQLYGSPPSYISCEDIHVGCFRYFSPPTIGQYHSSTYINNLGVVFNQLIELAKELWL